VQVTPLAAAGIVAGCLIPVFAVVAGVRSAARRGGVGQTPPGEPGPPFDPAAVVVSVRGGAWVNGINVTWPGATLRVGPDAAELTAFGCPAILIRRAEVTGLRWRRTPLGRGVQFRTATGRLDRVTFWPMVARGLADRMSELGWT
jgi:hypothetical protein